MTGVVKSMGVGKGGPEAVVVEAVVVKAVVVELAEADMGGTGRRRRRSDLWDSPPRGAGP